VGDERTQHHTPLHVMSAAELALFLSVFLACTVEAVEAVEALTIVLAVGITRGWSSALAGVGAAVAVLTAVVEAPGEDVERLSVNA
jgi:uncharacterized membrane protein